jgi:peptidylprolyl isomerase
MKKIVLITLASCSGIALASNPETITPTSATKPATNSTNSSNQQSKKIETTKNTKVTKNMTSSITRTNSGLGYEILSAGAGAKPKAGQTVTVHYTGYLDQNGKLGQKFDSSVDRGMPFSTAIGVGRVIAGWDEGLQDMQVGEKRRLYIPSKLGYGARGAGAVIPPNADLIFDVELIAVK